MGWGAMAGLGNAASAAGQGLMTMANTQREDAKDAYKEEAQRQMEERIHERTRTEKEADRVANKADAIEMLDYKDKKEKNDPLKALQMKKAQIELSAAEAETKLPPAVKLEYQALQKESELISTAVNKAQTDGTFDPSTSADILKRQESINKRMSALITPYQGDKAPKPGSGVDLSQFDKTRKPQQAAGATGEF